MSQEKASEVKAAARAPEQSNTYVRGVDDEAAIDGVDPVYAAKARVLNRAVCLVLPIHAFAPSESLDPRYWNGPVPMEAIFRDRLRLGSG